MSFLRYEKYKDSGVEWLGEVPNHWEVLKLKRIASFQSGEFITSDSIDPEGIYPVFGGNGLRGYTDTYTHEGEFALIGRQGALCGNINYGIGRFWASEHAVVVSPYDGIITKWVGELLRSMNLNQYSVSAAQPGLAVERIIDLYIPLPRKSEQTQIAQFLDHETDRIDTLIAEQQRLIELLKEKRQAVISHAVTKGLDPTVPMKDSGVEWLGEVPKHWKLKQVGHVASVARGTGYQNVEEVDESDDAIQMIRISDFNEFSPVRVARVSTLSPYIVDSRDVLIAGTGASAGITMRVTDNMGGMIHSYNAPRIRCTGIVPDFLYFVLNSHAIRQQEDVLFTGSAQHFLDLNAIAKLKFLMCDEDEQRDIVSYLRDQLKKFDSLESKADEAVELLQECRSAIISATVTGKIDVRNWQSFSNKLSETTLEATSHG